MPKADTLQRFLFEQAPIRGAIVRLNDSYQTILEQHQYPAAVSNLLGQILLAGVLLRHTLKGDGQLIVQLASDIEIKGENSPLTISLLSTKCNQKLEISGVAQFSEQSEASANSNLVVTFMPEDGSQPYQSIIPLPESAQQTLIANALESYFLQSEQLPTKFWLYADQQQALGLLVQQMPGQSHLEQNDFNLEMDEFRKDMLKQAFVHTGNQELLQTLFPKPDIRLFDLEPITFNCSCSMERMQNAIKTAGKEEAMDILKTNKTIEVKCEFCSKQYDFDKDEVNTLFTKNTDNWQTPPCQNKL